MDARKKCFTTLIETYYLSNRNFKLNSIWSIAYFLQLRSAVMHSTTIDSSPRVLTVSPDLNSTTKICVFRDCSDTQNKLHDAVFLLSVEWPFPIYTITKLKCLT